MEQLLLRKNVRNDDRNIFELYERGNGNKWIIAIPYEAI